METIIYYFSGRGNSLSVARGLAERMEGTEFKSMAGEKGDVTLAGERLGLVLPVIDFGIPAFVRNFIKRVRFEGAPPYVFAVITCGGMPGSSLLQLKKLLRKQGIDLAAGNTIVFGLESMADVEWNDRLDKMASSFKNKVEAPLPKTPLKDKLMTGLGNPLARFLIPGEDRKFRVDESCNGCAVCSRVCPVKNIEIVNGKPVWQHHCEQCAACFSWCPKMAISGTNLAARTHFTNRHVTLGQMLK